MINKKATFSNILEENHLYQRHDSSSRENSRTNSYKNLRDRRQSRRSRLPPAFRGIEREPSFDKINQDPNDDMTAYERNQQHKERLKQARKDGLDLAFRRI